MQQYGNQTTYNLETVLQQNIRNADFYKNDCLKLNNWTQVIDQIFYQVDYVEPWLAGNARGPSTAFCLLYRLFELKPSEDEVHATITHEDSPYIRAVSAAATAAAAAGGASCASRVPALPAAGSEAGVGGPTNGAAAAGQPEQVSLGPTMGRQLPERRLSQKKAQLSYSCLLTPCAVYVVWACLCRWVSCTCATWQTHASCGTGWGPTAKTRR